MIILLVQIKNSFPGFRLQAIMFNRLCGEGETCNKSAILKYFSENDLTLNFDSAKVINRLNSVIKLGFLEAFRIQNKKKP